MDAVGAVGAGISLPKPKGRGPRGRPFPPGVSGNPSGRPKSKPLTERLAELVEADKIIAPLLKMAYAGDLSAIRDVFDRLEGKAMQRVEFTLDDARDMARRIAGENGLDADALIAEAEAIARGEGRS